MIPVTHMKDRRVAVFGLGRSGLVSAHALTAAGAQVIAFDDKRERVETAWNEGLPVMDLRVADLSGLDALVLAPGVPLTHPEPHWIVAKAKAAGVPVVGDMELFARERAAAFPATHVVAITGTNGKSTTTALIGHLLRTLGRPVQVGGNIGRAVLDLDQPGQGDIIVLEVSSFQIDLAPSLAPDVGVHLNLSPDHLDRHGTMDAYAAIKERLVAAAGRAVVGVDDPMSAAIADRLEAAGIPVFRVGASGPLARGIAIEGPRLSEWLDGRARPIADLTGTASLRGAHNAQNAAAALAAVAALGLSAEEAAEGLASFPGLPHRMEEVGRLGDILIINDSKATNAESARRALESFERIHWIVGGVAKTGGISSLADLFGRIERAYLIGESATDFHGVLSGHVPIEVSGDLETALSHAVSHASEAAATGGPPPVILLSPACASFDQFVSFEDRGNRFRSAVRQLEGLAVGHAQW